MNFSGRRGACGENRWPSSRKRLIFALFDKGHGFVKENVLPVAFAFHAFAVADEEGVKVIGGRGHWSSTSRNHAFRGRVCDPSAIFR